MKKKMIAPIIITVLIIIYYIAYFGALIWIIDDLLFGVILGVVPIAFSIIMLYVCIQRINEIRSGEEDDLSKY